MEALLNFGYIGLFIGAFLAATIIPFSSDVLLVGLLAAGGDPIISITVGKLVGRSLFLLVGLYWKMGVA